jgi:hypothetical protein
MSIRLRCAATALMVPLLLASCAAAPGAGNEPGAVSGTAGLKPGVVAPTAPRSPATPKPTPGFVPGFPGDVAPGSIRWGAAIQGNGDPVARHESVAGVPMGVRRTYFGWTHRTGWMIRVARTDLAAGRLPWVSIKTPGWAAMASGAHDAEIDEMLRALDGLGGPVWLTVHHEPEGGNGTPYPDDGPGSEPAWRAMQQRIRDRMNAVGTRNIAFAPILMAWTHNPQSRRDPAAWWVDGIWDFAGIDSYQDNQAATTVVTRSLSRANAFYASKGLKMALGEWGNVGRDATAANEMTSFYRFATASGSTPGTSQVIAMAYFDSNLNSPKTGGWQLFGEPLNQFRQLMRAPTSLRVNQNG